MKICQRCPFPKSLSSGKGLAIASLKVISTLYHISNIFISWAYGHMKICRRCPFPKSLSSGKGLAIASLKVISTLYHISNLYYLMDVRTYENMSTLPFP